MPFGLYNAPSTFQRCMISVFSDLGEQCMEIFVDDFCVLGSSFDDSLSNMRKVLERCREKNLTLNWEKCHFMVKKGIGLGHIISRDGIEVDKAKTDLIVNLPPPTCVKEVRSFLGHVGFCRNFIKNFSKIAKPLTTLLAKDVPFHFSEECLVAFTKLKEALTSSTVLHPPVWGAPFELLSDASNYPIGVGLGQRVDKKPHVIYYTSHTLNDAQLNSTVTEKEIFCCEFWL